MNDPAAVSDGAVVAMGRHGEPWRHLAPDSDELADLAGSWRSAYVHIPFCRRRCPYCDFAVVTPEETSASHAAYIDAVVAEIGMEPEWAPLDAVNFGGGTPSAVAPGELIRVLEQLRTHFELAPDAEISLEANPEDWSEAWAEELLAAGFTRISWGVQSFDRDVLAALGRVHTPEGAVRAISGSQRAGFASVSVDLIFGTPGESASSSLRTVETAIGCRPDHVSAYALTVERGTALSRAVLAGARGPDADDQAEKYEALSEALRAAGLVQYEVSNWARCGHPCRYNLATWAQGEYVAFGLGAHGHRNGVRRRNVRRLDAYLTRVAQGVRPEAGSERLDAWGREQERMILGLRRRAGVEAGLGGHLLAASPEGSRLVSAGVLTFGRGRVRVVGPLLTDAASVAVLSLSPGDC
jgi:oxygen-independent coproporphyrinogen-3 oxidase